MYSLSGMARMSASVNSSGAWSSSGWPAWDPGFGSCSAQDERGGGHGIRVTRFGSRRSDGLLNGWYGQLGRRREEGLGTGFAGKPPGAERQRQPWRGRLAGAWGFGGGSTLGARVCWVPLSCRRFRRRPLCFGGGAGSVQASRSKYAHGFTGARLYLTPAIHRLGENVVHSPHRWCLHHARRPGTGQPLLQDVRGSSMPMNTILLWRFSPSAQGAQVAAHELVHALEDDLALGALHMQHALVAQHAQGRRC